MALKETCSHCGKQRSSLKRCSRCKQASYCGAECQNAGWKKHKKTCATIEEVWEKADAARAAGDWKVVLAFEGRLEELMEGQPDTGCNAVLCAFIQAHGGMALAEVDFLENRVSAFRLVERRINLLGRMQRFRDQGEAMCDLAGNLHVNDRHHESAKQFERARDVGAAHGLFSVECAACKGLGVLAMEEGQTEEGMALLQNALVASRLCHGEDTNHEPAILWLLIDALLKTHALDEVEPLVLRYRELAQEESRRKGFCCDELSSLLFDARLHEARGKPHEAEREMRALLDLVRKNTAALHDQPISCKLLVSHVISHLAMLDEELIMSVATELANLGQGLQQGPGAELQQGPGAA